MKKFNFLAVMLLTALTFCLIGSEESMRLLIQHGAHVQLPPLAKTSFPEQKSVLCCSLDEFNQSCLEKTAKNVVISKVVLTAQHREQSFNRAVLELLELYYPNTQSLTLVGYQPSVFDAQVDPTKLNFNALAASRLASTLRSLKLRNCGDLRPAQFNTVNFDRFVELISLRVTDKRQDYYNKKARNIFFAHLARSILSKRIKKLELDFPGLIPNDYFRTREDAQAFKNLLNKFTCLTYLDLRGMIFDDGLVALAYSWAVPAITTLVLIRCSINGSAFESSSMHNLVSLTSLDISENKFLDGRIFRAVADSVLAARLKKLSMRECLLDWPNFDKTCLDKFTNLEELDVSDNGRIEGIGFKALTQSQLAQRLIKLVMQRCYIDREWLKESSIENFTSLTHLDLSGNSLHTDILFILARNKAKLQIRQLILKDCQIDSWLDWDEKRLTIEVIDTVLAMLEELDLRENYLRKSTLALLRESQHASKLKVPNMQ